MRHKLFYLFILNGLGMWYGKAYAAAASSAIEPAIGTVQFDERFFAPGGGNIELSRFEKGNLVAPGTYTVDVTVNQQRMARAVDITFKATHDGNSSAQPCFSQALLIRLGVDLGKLTPDVAKQLAQPENCLPISDIIESASTDFDFGEQRLDVSIPQVALVRMARGYVPPELWDSGVNAAVLGYSLSAYSQKPNQGSSTTSGYLGLNAGINIDEWHLRHNGSYTFDNKGNRNYQDINTYVQRDLPSLRSQLLIGESYTDGTLFDSIAFRGVQVYSDDRMLPDSLRGYAPTVRGVANTNARVTVTQRGIVIYETTVAPGAFEITDLFPTGYGGDLDVQIHEADGSVRTFSVPFAAVPMSLRPGVSRYNVVAGSVRNEGGNSHPLFAQGTLQRGLTNTVTAYAGATGASGYASVLAGGVFNTRLGAFGADVTHAETSLRQLGHYSGESYRVSYAKNLPATSTNLTLAAYRYSTNGFFTLSNAVRTRDFANQSQTIGTLLRQRSNASVTVSQGLGQQGGQLSLTASSVNYWNRSGSDTNYSVFYNNHWKRLSYSMSATRQRSATGQADTQYSVGINLPLGEPQRALSLGSSVTHSGNSGTLVQASVGGGFGQQREGSFSAGGSYNDGGGAASSYHSAYGNLNYRSPLAELMGGISGGSQYTQMSVGARGAIVLHSGGITLSQPVSDTFAIVEAKDAVGAALPYQPGLRVDGRGYAIVPFLTPYRMNTVEIDPKGLSTDVELKVTSQEVAPKAGAIARLSYTTAVSRAFLIHVTQPDGSPLPFGALVLDETGQEVGVVGQGSKLFVRGLNDQGELTIAWGDDAAARCRVPYQLPAKDGHATDLPLIQASCLGDREVVSAKANESTAPRQLSLALPPQAD